MIMNINWKIKPFEELSNAELYNILRLRAEVFIVEQNCPYLDLDGKDQASFHLMGLNNEQQLVAYARLLPAGLAFNEVSIGRVLSSSAARGSGAGMELMQTAIHEINKKFGDVSIRIGAQLYLKKFYERLGFVQVSEMYLEDDIEHVEMLRSK
jgi:ElaA protein